LKVNERLQELQQTRIVADTLDIFTQEHQEKLIILEQNTTKLIEGKPYKRKLLKNVKNSKNNTQDLRRNCKLTMSY
jgi:hypothetical protein